MKICKTFFAAAMFAGALILTGGLSDKAQAQTPQAFEGDFMIRFLGSAVVADEDLGTTTLNGGVVAGAGIDIDATIIPATTLTYFISPNIAAELYCCIARVNVDGTGGLAAFNELASVSFFAPTVTLQYHIPMGALKPYVGVGVNYLLFFDESVGSGLAAATSKFDIDDSWGLALQAGVDIALGGNMSLNLDVKKIFTETDAQWTGANTVIANNVQIDPWIISVGFGWRFDSCALLRRCAAESLK